MSPLIQSTRISITPPMSAREMITGSRQQPYRPLAARARAVLHHEVGERVPALATHPFEAVAHADDLERDHASLAAVAR